MGRKPPELWEEIEFEHFGLAPEEVYTGNGLSDYYNKAKNIVKKIYTGDTGMPPNVEKILRLYGTYYIKNIEIIRNPVSDVLTGAMSAVSWGEFGRNLESSPYDKLFHLKIVMTLTDDNRIGFEKVERVKLSMDPKDEKVQEVINVDLNGRYNITLNELYNNALNLMGYNKFYSYSARDNNCQNFILSVLQANNLGNDNDYKFVKQDTKSLFGKNSFLRKVSNTLTDVGARFNVLQQGGYLIN